MCAVGDIFCVVVIEFRAGVNFAADGGKRIVVAEHGDLDLLPADEFLDQNLAVVFQRRLNCRFQLGAVLRLCNADGRAGSSGLDEDGIGEARLNGAQRRFPAAGKALARDELPRCLPDACGVGDQLCDGLIHTGGGGRDVRTDIGNACDLE